MKQEIFVIGRDLKELVPFSITFKGPNYSITLVETRDVVGRALALASTHPGWFLLIVPEDEDCQASEQLEQVAPTTSLVLADGEDPLIALAHLIAADAWEAQPVPNSAAALMTKADGSNA